MKHEAAWYVIQVLAGTEQGIAGRLAEAGMRTAAPVEVLHERRNGKWWPVRRTVFPGYVFVRTELSPRIYHYIKRLPNVIRLLGAGTPEAVPDQQMETVLLLANDGRDFGVSLGEKTGGKTVITSGPLARLEDKIIKVNARGRRATVEIGVLGETHQVDVGLVVTQTPAADEEQTLADTTPESGAR